MIEKQNNINQFLLRAAERIPTKYRKQILEEELIDKAINTPALGTSMEFLFDIYESYIDVSGEHDDWNCHTCRDFVLRDFRRLKKYLVMLEEQAKNEVRL